MTVTGWREWERFKAVVLDRDRNGAVWAFREWWERRSIDGGTDGPTLGVSSNSNKQKRILWGYKQRLKERREMIKQEKGRTVP